MNTVSTCAACGSREWSHVENWRGFEIVQCHECGLQFTLNPQYEPEQYEDAYEGSGNIPVPEEHSYVYTSPAERLRLEADALFVAPPRLTPAERLALRWLRNNAPRNALVVDCGCGTGRFLRALNRHGFQSVGIDISAEIVDLLSKAGLTAVQGKAPDFPWNGEDPFAITFFEVLEHIPMPVEMLNTLRERFPKTAIIASVPSPYRPGLLFKGKRGLSDYPPNHFLRWTPKALEIAFQKAGYREVKVILPKPVGSEMLPGLGQIVFKLRERLRSGRKGEQGATPQQRKQRSNEITLTHRIKTTAALWILYLYQRTADVVGFPKAWLASRRGASAASMLVIAEP